MTLRFRDAHRRRIEVGTNIAVVAEPDRVADALRARWGGVVDRMGFSTPYAMAPELLGPIVAELLLA